METCSVSELNVFFVSGGKTIAIDCFIPEAQGQARFPAIIALHGSGGGHDTLAQTARPLAARGFCVYVPHYFDRTGTVEAQMPAMFLNFPLWMKTLWDVVSLVMQQPAVDSDRIGVLGFSLGAYLALSLGGIDARVQTVAEYFGGLPREIRPFMRRLPPTLILHGDADTVVPVAEAFRLQKALEERKVPYELKIYPGEGHDFTPETRIKADGQMHAFFRKYLVEGRQVGGTFAAASPYPDSEAGGEVCLHSCCGACSSCCAGRSPC
jgi:carboxymethylenebutenolidase